MLVLFPPLLLFAAASAVAILRFTRPDFRFSWLISVAAAFLALLAVLLWQPQLPLSSLASVAHPAGLASTTLAFSVPSLLWPYALGLSGLALAILLTAPGRDGFPNPSGFAMTLSLTGLGLLAVTAANAVTLAFAWAGFDLVDLVVKLRWSQGSKASERAVIAFSIRAGGIVLLLLAQVLGGPAGQLGDFGTMQAGVGLMVIAAALRLGILPPGIPYGPETTLPDGVWTTFRLTSAAASLALLSRFPAGSLGGPATPVLMLLCAVPALYSGWRWLRAPDEFAGSRFWISGIASLAVVCALRGNAAGSTAWGVALILVGGALFLSSNHRAWLNRLLLVGAWSISSLPLSLTAIGWKNPSGMLDWALPILLIAQALLLAGFLQHAFRPSSRAPLEAQSLWAGSVHPVGILLLLMLQLLLTLWGWMGAWEVGPWLAGGAASALGLAFLWVIPRFADPRASLAWLPRDSSLSVAGFYLDLKTVFSGLTRVSETITDVLQGEAGIIWSLVLLILFVSLIAGRSL
jgi:hypothetical protein